MFTGAAHICLSCSYSKHGKQNCGPLEFVFVLLSGNVHKSGPVHGVYIAYDYRDAPVHRV